MSIGINFDDENDPYFDQPIGYHFDDIEWEHFVLNKENQHGNDQPIRKNENYNLYKDMKVRENIVALASYSSYIGVTTTEITDGATTNPINVNGKLVTAKPGGIVLCGSKEYIFTGAIWREFCDISDEEYNIPDRVQKCQVDFKNTR